MVREENVVERCLVLALVANVCFCLLSFVFLIGVSDYSVRDSYLYAIHQYSS